MSTGKLPATAAPNLQQLVHIFCSQMLPHNQSDLDGNAKLSTCKVCGGRGQVRHLVKQLCLKKMVDNTTRRRLSINVQLVDSIQSPAGKDSYFGASVGLHGDSLIVGANGYRKFFVSNFLKLYYSN